MKDWERVALPAQEMVSSQFLSNAGTKSKTMYKCNQDTSDSDTYIELNCKILVVQV